MTCPLTFSVACLCRATCRQPLCQAAEWTNQTMARQFQGCYAVSSGPYRLQGLLELLRIDVKPSAKTSLWTVVPMSATDDQSPDKRPSNHQPREHFCNPASSR